MKTYTEEQIIGAVVNEYVRCRETAERWELMLEMQANALKAVLRTLGIDPKSLREEVPL